jgi:hypothetical protein
MRKFFRWLISLFVCRLQKRHRWEPDLFLAPVYDRGWIPDPRDPRFIRRTIFRTRMEICSLCDNARMARHHAPVASDWSYPERLSHWVEV